MYLPKWLPQLSYEVLKSAVHSLTSSDWIVVGALARDYAFRESEDLMTLRATNDVDIAALVQSWTEFAATVDLLCGSGHFHQTNTLHRLQHENGQLMDLVPFGGIEHNYRIVWPPDGEMEMNVMGFRDILKTSTCTTLPGELTVRIASPPAVVFLKLVAWHDSPSERERDLEDIAAFIRGYITEILGWERTFAQYEFVMAADDLDLEAAGAYILGCEIATLLSADVYEQALELTAHLSDSDGRFTTHIREYLKTSHEHTQRISSELFRGLKEGAPKNV